MCEEGVGESVPSFSPAALPCLLQHLPDDGPPAPHHLSLHLHLMSVGPALTTEL